MSGGLFRPKLLNKDGCDISIISKDFTARYIQQYSYPLQGGDINKFNSLQNFKSTYLSTNSHSRIDIFIDFKVNFQWKSINISLKF